MKGERVVSTKHNDIWSRGDTVSMVTMGLYSLPPQGYSAPFKNTLELALSSNELAHQFRDDVITLGRSMGLDFQPQAVTICGTKYGLYERIFFMKDNGKDGESPHFFIITKPKTFRTSDVFLESQRALSLGGKNASRLGIDALVYPRAYLETINTPTAYFDVLNEPYEEINMALNSGVPSPTFLTNELKVNTPFQQLSAHERSFLCAYFVAKVCMARAMMTLLTLHKDESSRYVVGYRPKEASINAGDHVGYFDPEGKLHLITTTFRGGVLQCLSYTDLVDSLLKAQEPFISSSLDFEAISLVPLFKQGKKAREQWVSDIVKWSMRLILEQIQVRNDAHYFQLLQEFLVYSGFDIRELSKTSSPFSVKLLQKVSDNFGQSWTAHMTPLPQELLLYVKE